MSIFTALAEPTRRTILDLLRDGGERTAGELVDGVGLAQPTVSQHLKVLREAGLVSVRPDANRRLYRLRPDAFVELDEWLAPYRRIWAGRLDDLEAHLDAMAREDLAREDLARDADVDRTQPTQGDHR